jgi:hypothetical protein
MLGMEIHRRVDVCVRRGKEGRKGGNPWHRVAKEWGYD